MTYLMNLPPWALVLLGLLLGLVVVPRVRAMLGK